MSTTEFRPSRIFSTKSREFIIASKLVSGKSREEVMSELAPKVGEDTRWTYYQNRGGRRGRPDWQSEPKPPIDQFRLFIHTVDTTIKKMEKAGWTNSETRSEKDKWSSKERSLINFRGRYARTLMEDALRDRLNPEPMQIPEPGSVPPVFQGKPEPEPLPPLPPDEYDEYGNLVVEYYYDGDKIASRNVEPPPHSRADDIDLFYKMMMRARSFTDSRALAGEYLDFISTRAIKDGSKAIAHGIKINEIVEAIVKTWPQDSRDELARWTQEWQPKPKAIDPKPYAHKANIEGAHIFLGYVMYLSEARIPIFLVGPSGCGKSFLARDLADALDMDYGEIPLTAGATPSWLVGAETISGYKSRPFVDIYAAGGVFCLEEIDAADPNMLLLINNALANNFFTNPVTGAEIQKHKDFIPVATANTWGLGANRQFTGRERLDAATLDRWRVGRVEMDYDADVEGMIIDEWKEKARKLEGPRKAKPKKDN